MGDTIASVGDRLADRLVEVDPLLASDWGVATCDLPELSPSWLEERREVFASAIASVTSSDVPESERVAAALLAERCEAEVAWFDSGEAFSELQAALDSPLFRVRHCFDEMPTDSDNDWENIARRLIQVPSSLAGLRESFDVGRRSRTAAAARQVEASAAAAASWAGESEAKSVFVDLVAPRATRNDALAAVLEGAAATASAAFAEMSDWLRTTYLPSARADDAVGPERFTVWSRRYAGAVLGAEDYEWAAERLADANADQGRLRDEVDRAGPSATVTGEAAHVRWAEEQIAHAIRTCAMLQLLPSSDLPRVVVRPRPAAEGDAAYYTPPSEDGTAPATMWWPGGDGPHEVEYAKTVLFHESVPGHHVESSFQRRATGLNRFQRLVYIPGHSEGWGLYAERLAEEAGLIDTAHARLGCRGSQALRLASLLIDIGIHTGIRPSPHVTDLVGVQWSINGATALAAAQGLDPASASWWVTNMLGRPAHRASYAAGERAWLRARTRSAAAGEATGAFHARILSLGPLGLDQLNSEATL